MNCKAMEEKLVLDLYGELTAEERAAVEAHLKGCPQCAATAAELGRLRAALDARPRREPSPELLVHCRADLEEALDREASGWRGLIRSWLGMAPGQPALRAASALAVLVLGVSLGWTLRPQLAGPGAGSNGPMGAWTGADLSGMRISGISQVTPDPQTGAVRITLDAERRLTLQGSLDDPRIQQVLLYAVKNYDNAGIRHDTLELLRNRTDNPTVREALLYALRHDPNPGVRLGVVEAVRGMAWGPDVRRTLLEALERDDNPGVRVAAIDILTEHADEQVLPALEQLAREDRNPYVRLKCTNAVRQRAQEEF
ncbi:MAG: HEAT repeat domain-containing protein [Acidobacteria bacterium]|nr:HEAT repeat domain-containing protein [Acidobacteriota bacterium]